MSLANEYFRDVTISTQVIKYKKFGLQADHPIRLQYSHQIKLFIIITEPNPGVVVDGFVVDSAAMQDNAATFYWNWDMSKNNLLNGKFQGFKVGIVWLLMPIVL